MSVDSNPFKSINYFLLSKIWIYSHIFHLWNCAIKCLKIIIENSIFSNILMVYEYIAMYNNQSKLVLD